MGKFRIAGVAVFALAITGLTPLYLEYGRRPEVLPEVVRIGVLPDENEVVLQQRYAPLIQLLFDEVGVPFELVIPTDYADLLTMFGRGDVDLAFFGGLTFLLAHDQYGAVPMVMRDVDVEFRSFFIARPDGDASRRSLVDFKGLDFSFGSSLSTSGHLMPRSFLEQEGINAELFFSSVEYSGAHDKTAEWVRDRRVDIGVANGQVIEKMFSDGRLSSNDIQVIWITPPYPDYVFAVRRDLGAPLQEKIQSTFLSLGSLDEKHQYILRKIGAGGFLPAVLADFDELREVAQSQGLL